MLQHAPVNNLLLFPWCREPDASTEQPPTQSRYSMHLVWFAELSAWNVTRAKSHFLYSVHFTNPTSKTASISATMPRGSFIRSSTDVPLSEVLHQSRKTRTYGVLLRPVDALCALPLVSPMLSIHFLQQPQHPVVTSSVIKISLKFHCLHATGLLV